MEKPIELHSDSWELIEGTLESNFYVFDGTKNIKISEPDNAKDSTNDRILI